MPREPREERDEPPVPRHIRSEELMPAATGGFRRAKGEGGLKPRPRRRRRGAPSGAANGAGAPPMLEQRPPGFSAPQEPTGEDEG